MEAGIGTAGPVTRSIPGPAVHWYRCSLNGPLDRKMPGSSSLNKWQPVTSVRIVSEPQHRRTERMIIAFDHVDKNGVQHADVLIIPGPELPRRHASDRPRGDTHRQRGRVRPHLDRIAGSRQPYESK